MATAHPGQWSIHGQSYSIPSTYYLVLPGDSGRAELMFVAELDGLDPASTANLTEAGADVLALPVMQHIARNELHGRSEIREAGGAPLDVVWIGVVVLTETGAFRTSGVRTRRRLSELREMLDAKE